MSNRQQTKRAFVLFAILPIVTLMVRAPSGRYEHDLQEFTPTPLPQQVLSAACTSRNPYLALTILYPADDGGFSQDKETVIAVHDTPNDNFVDNVNNQIHLASQGQVGAVYGLAYDPLQNHLYTSAFHAIQKPFGSEGPGGIYRIDLNTGLVSPFARLDAGQDPHSKNLRGVYDTKSAPWVGKVGLGDIDLDTELTTLFVVNLFDRKIYRIAVSDGSVIGAFANGAMGEPWADDARPFGLGYKNGWLFHGVIDSRESIRRGPPRGYVYRSRPDGSEMSLAATIDLGYSHRPAWGEWRAVVSNPLIASQPLVSDIEFRQNGDLIIGLRNRVIDMTERLVAGGDVLQAIRIDPAHWQVSMPEFYHDKTTVGREDFADASVGGLAVLPQTDTVVTTGTSDYSNTTRPFGAEAVLWFDNVTGFIHGPFQGIEWLTADFSGEGDLEILCPRDVPTTAPSPTPNSTPSPVPTASTTPTVPSTPTLTPTPTPTLQPTQTHTPPQPVYAVYLPLARQGCVGKRLYADVALVLDRSTSMLRPVNEGGQPKNSAAIAAARQFVDQLNLSPDEDGAHDRVALVGFNDTAWTEEGLTNDVRTISAGLERLSQQVAEGTRLDLALLQGQVALVGSPVSFVNRKVLILLTDGIPNRVPFPPGGRQEDTVLAAAKGIKDKATIIYTIGLGKKEDIATDLLRVAASAPSTYYEVPEPGELAGIYTQIARLIEVCLP